MGEGWVAHDYEEHMCIDDLANKPIELELEENMGDPVGSDCKDQMV
jgi:hypothetical protein